MIFNELDAGSMIRRIRPQIIVKGKSFLNKQMPAEKAIEEIGAKLEFFPEY